MVTQGVWIAITVGVFIVGIGIGYSIFVNTNQMPGFSPMMGGSQMDSMMDNPQTMNQMMQDPQFMQQMGQMMDEPEFQKQMMQNMENHDSLMHEMMQDYGMREHMMGHLMADEELMQNMGIAMTKESTMSSGMDSTMVGMSFNTNAPITMPMIEGYYNGDKVFFVHTEVSDKDMAEMMSMMINFPTLHTSNLKDIPSEEMAKLYVFTNGISGSGPYGGGPFMYQIDVFDSIPDQMGYSQFRVPHLVTWNENSTPRILISVDEIMSAESKGELTIQKTDNVVNAPMLIWKSEGKDQRASLIPRMFEDMPDVDGEVTNVDLDNYSVTFKMNSKIENDIMGNGMMNP